MTMVFQEKASAPIAKKAWPITMKVPKTQIWIRQPHLSTVTPMTSGRSTLGKEYPE